MCSWQLLCILQFPLYGKSSNLQLLIDQVQSCYRSLSEGQGSTLGPTVFTLFANDLLSWPLCLPNPSMYMFADDTTVYCMSDTAEKSIAQLNTALRELNEWCLINRPTPHTSKSEAILISGRNPPVNIPPIFVGNSTIEWVSKSRLLRITGNEKLTWTPQMLELKISFAKKLGLLKKSRFLPGSVRQDPYFRVILPSVAYGLKLWGSFCNSDLFQSLERLHSRLRDLFLICLKTWHRLKSYNGTNRRPSLFIVNLLFLSVFIKLHFISSPQPN